MRAFINGSEKSEFSNVTVILIYIQTKQNVKKLNYMAKLSWNINTLKHWNIEYNLLHSGEIESY